MRITVFTPTYNRAYIIEKLYRSLQAQTFKDFEWLVIDDGSTDATKNLFEIWKKEDNAFPIRYIYSENKGKMKEINRGLELAQGELFFNVDSDDTLPKHSLEKINAWEKMMPHNGSFCGVAGNMGYSETVSNNKMLPGEYYDALLFQRYPGFGKEYIGADRAWVFYTEIYRKYKFPEFEDENFIAEAVVWNRMAKDGLKIRCYNDIVYLFEHQDDGLTKSISQTLIQNPKGYGLWKSEMIRYLKYPLIKQLKEYYIFYCDLVEKYDVKDIASFINCSYLLMRGIALIYKLKPRRQK